MLTRKQQYLSVLPNPYYKLDGYGNPAGVLAVDPSVDPGRNFVGATIDKVEVLDTLERGDLRAPRQDIYYKFELETPTEVPVTPYYLEAIRNGYLFAADEATARRAGVKLRGKDELLTEASEQARKFWQETYLEECPLPAHEAPKAAKKTQPDMVLFKEEAKGTAFDDTLPDYNKKVDAKK